jgi:hypothetical protein
MTAKGTSINAKTSPARTLNPVSTLVGRCESTERPQWGHTEWCARVLEGSRVESAIEILLILLRESLSVVKRCKCISLAFVAADFQQLFACCVFR